MNKLQASYNLRAHVPSDVPVHNQISVAKNLKSQQQLDEINVWTEKMKMQLNEKKTQNIIFNFSKKKQFVTIVNNKNIELVREVKLLRTCITDDLKLSKNTKEIVKKAYSRMQLLHRAASFTANIHDLKSIYLTYVRSVLEQKAVVWHSGRTDKNRRDHEIVQKAAVRVILKTKYENYKEGLKKLKIETLEKRNSLLEICKHLPQEFKSKQFLP